MTNCGTDQAQVGMIALYTPILHVLASLLRDDEIVHQYAAGTECGEGRTGAWQSKAEGTRPGSVSGLHVLRFGPRCTIPLLFGPAHENAGRDERRKERTTCLRSSTAPLDKVAPEKLFIGHGI